jgi:hypothetical protein
MSNHVASSKSVGPSWETNGLVDAHEGYSSAELADKALPATSQVSAAVSSIKVCQ